MIENSPNVGDRLYLMQQEIVVTQIYKNFHLIKIHFAKKSEEFFVDASVISRTPDATNSISLKFLQEGK